MKYNEDISLQGRDSLPNHGLNNITVENSITVNRYEAHVKLMPGWQPKILVLRNQRIPQQLQGTIPEKLEHIVRQGYHERLQPGGVHEFITSCVAAKKGEISEFYFDRNAHIFGMAKDEQ